MKCFFIGNQEVVLFPKYRKNGWEATTSALRALATASLQVVMFPFRKNVKKVAKSHSQQTP